MNQLSFDLAAARRDDGMQRAVDHAERVAAGWKRRAHGYLLEFLCSRKESFLTEDVREFSERKGLDAPPDGRAWGAIMRAAAKEKIITKIGYAPAKSSNLSPKVLWKPA